MQSGQPPDAKQSSCASMGAGQSQRIRTRALVGRFSWANPKFGIRTSVYKSNITESFKKKRQTENITS